MSSLKPLLKVALIGRPNVGKSSLFNKLTRTRKSVVRNEPGVTRDILIESAEWWGKTFEVVDTGGLTESQEGFSPLIFEQVVSMLKSVDALIVVMDGKLGLVPEDREVLRIAKETGLPFLLVVNKVDRTTEAELAVGEFYEFGMDVIPAAFEKDFGIDHIVEWILRHSEEGERAPREGIRIAIIGKPNVGKSSLCNYLLGERRMLVSDIAGTTVDAVESEFEFEGQNYILTDTAGLRRGSKRKEVIEQLSAIKSEEAIRRSNIVLLLVDAVVGPSQQDARMIDLCMEQHKALILVANKMDLAQNEHEDARAWFRERVEREFHFYQDIPLAFISAKTGRGVDQLFRRIKDLHEKLFTRISTSKLNNFFMEVIRKAPAPVWGTKDVKFYYLTQTHQVPPSFIAFVNHPDGVTPAYRRFLSKNIQQAFDLEGVPIRIFALPSKTGGRAKRTKASEWVQDQAADHNLVEFEYDLEGVEE
jgi:GTP-binding protein